MSDVVGKVTKTKALAELVLENMSLKLDAEESQKRILALIDRVSQLEKEKTTSANFSLFKECLERAFEYGEIPLPRVILKREKPVTIQVLNDSIRFSHGSVVVPVTFTSGGYSVSCEFVFGPVLYDDSRHNIYPDFCPATYHKLVSLVTSTQKPRARKLKPTPLPNVATS